MPWFTITDGVDAGVDAWHGMDMFYRDGDRVFRTYFINNRGDEQMGSTWNYLDTTPLGRHSCCKLRRRQSAGGRCRNEWTPGSLRRIARDRRRA